LDILAPEDPKLVGRDTQGDGEYGEEPPILNGGEVINNLKVKNCTLVVGILTWEVMTLAIEILREIEGTEKQAEEIIRTARKEAEDLIKEAERDADKEVREQLARAEKEAQALIAQAEKEALAKVDSLKEEGSQEIARLRKMAAARKEKAMQLLLEKVVSNPWQ
jgi:V/A-type H+-transporting ATPase subunit G/H